MGILAYNGKVGLQFYKSLVPPKDYTKELTITKDSTKHLYLGNPNSGVWALNYPYENKRPFIWTQNNLYFTNRVNLPMEGNDFKVPIHNCIDLVNLKVLINHTAGSEDQLPEIFKDGTGFEVMRKKEGYCLSEKLNRSDYDFFPLKSSNGWELNYIVKTPLLGLELDNTYTYYLQYGDKYSSYVTPQSESFHSYIFIEPYPSTNKYIYKKQNFRNLDEWDIKLIDENPLSGDEIELHEEDLKNVKRGFIDKSLFKNKDSRFNLRCTCTVNEGETGIKFYNSPPPHLSDGVTVKKIIRNEFGEIIKLEENFQKANPYSNLVYFIVDPVNTNNVIFKINVEDFLEGEYFATFIYGDVVFKTDLNKVSPTYKRVKTFHFNIIETGNFK